MPLICPSCQNTKVSKNGSTHYGKQNHKCTTCNRQFVRNNTHYIPSEKKHIITGLLKERLSLRAICRACKVSMNWLIKYARSLWAGTPKDIGICSGVLQKLQKLQLLRLQMDEMWSFVGKKLKKRWLWLCYDPMHRLVIAHHVGGRGKRDARKFWGKIPAVLHGSKFETDHWNAYESILDKGQHKVGKHLTYYIEGFHATVRTRVSRLVRKTLSFSKKDEWHNKAIAWFFWQLNLQRKPYI